MQLLRVCSFNFQISGQLHRCSNQVDGDQAVPAAPHTKVAVATTPSQRLPHQLQAQHRPYLHLPLRSTEAKEVKDLVADTGDADVAEAYAAEDAAEEQPEEFFETIEENLEEDNEATAEDGEAPDDDLGTSLQDLAQVLSVTSKKLQATVLGRKFTGRKSIDERKRTSTCSACGAIGHWAGDAVCSVSASTKGSGKGGKKGKDKHGGKDKSGGQPFSSSTSTAPKKAFVVSYGEEYPGEDLGHDMFLNYPTSFVDSVHSPLVYITQTIDLGGYMVLDTACQRSCAGQRWMQTHARLLDNHGMGFHREECHDRFQFGAGSTQQAAERCLFRPALQARRLRASFFV